MIDLFQLLYTGRLALFSWPATLFLVACLLGGSVDEILWASVIGAMFGLAVSKDSWTKTRTP